MLTVLNVGLLYMGFSSTLGYFFGRPKNNCRRSFFKEASRSWNELRIPAADENRKNS
jgi:hypothetical protein